jgi:hypothetical protein
MTKKHVGGRGRKASNKHQTFSISLPPHLKAALDAAVTEEVSRSEVVAGLIEAHLLKSAPPARPAGARAAAPQKKAAKPPATNLPAAVTVMAQQMKRGLGWKPEKYADAEKLLAEGYTITRKPDSADYSTEKGGLVSWRTVQALLKLGVVVPLTD